MRQERTGLGITNFGARVLFPCYQRLDTWQQIGIEEELLA